MSPRMNDGSRADGDQRRAVAAPGSPRVDAPGPASPRWASAASGPASPRSASAASGPASPRWASAASRAVLGALGATILAACQPSTGLDMSKPLQDGTWSAQSNADDQGSVGTITITVEGGSITSTSYTTAMSDGSDKGGDYGKDSSGRVFNQDYYDKAQAAVASYQEYSDNLTQVGDPAKVDVISGATVAHQQFVQAAIRAIAAAQGVSPDGADDIDIPGLNDSTKDSDVDGSDS